MSSGGDPLTRISDQPLDPTEVEKAVIGPEHGAVVLFTGTVRNHDGGQPVSTLEYSAHPEADKFLHRVCTEVSESTGLPVAAIHRIGHLAIGDLAIAVAVAAPHRAEAFTTCATLVDRIKHEVPIWKRQLFTDGLSEWVNACG
ncbi:molybdenum cofactor biosynthesis protein MoaE [Nocardia sp. SYP-A9097]|uniref:molybdenum cofactor biosynthesis protein MoaE n=1 Tax=Nocardia sp. SYP-A9097 TaxID=2663237 RepID=UPI00129A108F|nr:molybdenum cofactor biosynthesis protein MoaE [Nocardia sp. SYP-A9097]MRH89039.1 molybdenum cofactor biosynthesis protein MoaE [Nocardia sp. SYP-A9097]